MAVCETYCSHGGMCELDKGHEGLHDTRYCQWSDAEAVTKAVADAEVSRKPGGAEVVMMQDLFMGLLGEDYEEGQ